MGLVKILKKLASFSVVLIGVVLEHFDMMAVNLYATSMVTHFVDPAYAKQSVILGFIGYSISFLFRPLGAAFFGMIGDLAGRKPSMLLSLVFMSIATLGLGLIPSFQAIGSVSTILFVLCRITQGLCIGGEYGTALTYSYEFAGKNKTTAGAAVIGATHIGGLIAAIFATHLQASFLAVFQIAGVIGLLSFGLRSLLVESRPMESVKVSIREIVSASYENRKAYRRSFIIASALVFTFYSSLIYLNEVIFQRGLATRQDIFRSNCYLLMLWAILPPLLGYGVDRFNLSYRKVMQVGSAGVAMLVLPILGIANHINTFSAIVGAQLCLGILHMVYCFGTPRYLGDQFSSNIRSTGVAFSYSLGASFTAALTPLICHMIVSSVGMLEAIAAPICILSGLATVLLIESNPSTFQEMEVPIT